MANPASQIGSMSGNMVGSILTQPLWFQDSALAALRGLFATAFAGFKWEVPRELNLINFNYSNYTYYNEEISSGIVEAQSTITVTAIRELSFINTYTTNIVTNNFMVTTLKDYAKNGGLFLLITPTGFVKNLALENLSVSFNGTNPNPIFTFKFRKLIVSKIGTKGMEMDERAKGCI